MGDQEGRPYGVSSSLIRRDDVGIVPNEMFYGGGHVRCGGVRATHPTGSKETGVRSAAGHIRKEIFA